MSVINGFKNVCPKCGERFVLPSSLAEHICPTNKNQTTSDTLETVLDTTCDVISSVVDSSSDVVSSVADICSSIDF